VIIVLGDHPCSPGMFRLVCRRWRVVRSFHWPRYDGQLKRLDGVDETDRCPRHDEDGDNDEQSQRDFELVAEPGPPSPLQLCPQSVRLYPQSVLSVASTVLIQTYMNSPVSSVCPAVSSVCPSTVLIYTVTTGFSWLSSSSALSDLQLCSQFHGQPPVDCLGRSGRECAVVVVVVVVAVRRGRYGVNVVVVVVVVVTVH